MHAARKHKRCLHPLASPEICDKIVSAHSVQRSRTLEQIIDCTRHVNTFFPPTSDSAGRLKLHTVGWREASTFTGYCAKHDAIAFEPLEKTDFCGTPEQCFLVAYRALCHEVYQKLGILKADAVVRQMVDRGFSTEDQRDVQDFWNTFEAGSRDGLSDFQRLKAVMDKQLLSKDYSGWSRVVINFQGDLCVASTGTVSPNRNLEGEELQTLHNQDVPMESLPFGVVAAPQGGAVVFCWRGGEVAPQMFVEALLKKGIDRLPGLLVQFMFAYVENTFFSPSWWEALSEDDRRHLENLAAIGNPYYTDFQYSIAQFVPWKVTGIVSVAAAENLL
jgi:hypothetical protein